MGSGVLSGARRWKALVVGAAVLVVVASMFVVVPAVVPSTSAMDAALSEVYSFRYSVDEEELHRDLSQNVERLARFGPNVIERILPWLNVTGAALDANDMAVIVAHAVMVRLGESGIPEVSRLALSQESPLSARSGLVRHLLDYEGHPDARAALGRLAGSPDPKVREMVDRQKRVKAAVDAAVRGDIGGHP